MGIEVLSWIALFVISLSVLLKASDWFIDSAEDIGLSLGISPFIIGVTIIAFGTSLPELATSIVAVLEGDSEIVVGNVVGSNVTNIALVLGLVAVSVKTIRLDYNIWHIDMPFLWGSAFLLMFSLRDGRFSYFEAVLFLICIVVFLVYSFNKDDDEKIEPQKASARSFVLLIVGGILVWMGADYTIVAIKELSAIAGIDKEIIALSAVAFGTSLPEIIVSINAARKGRTSIAVGNVLGSNIFNTFVVMGISRMVGELTIPDSIQELYLPFMIVMTILFGVMASNKKITNWEGILLIVFYIYFIGEMFAFT